MVGRPFGGLLTTVPAATAVVASLVAVSEKPSSSSKVTVTWMVSPSWLEVSSRLDAVAPSMLEPPAVHWYWYEALDKPFPSVIAEASAFRESPTWGVPPMVGWPVAERLMASWMETVKGSPF